MKYVYQVGVILAVSLAGEILHAVIPLPVPASIYGLLLMLLCLRLRVIRLEHVDGAGSFLLEILPLLFVPPAVGLMATWEQLSMILLPAIAAVLLVTPFVMVSTGLATQAAMRGRKRP